MICKFNNAHEVTGFQDRPSVLHENLRKAFPDSVEDGDSSLYVMVRTDPKFLEWFGDWTNSDTHKTLLQNSINTQVFNEQGEPQLIRESTGLYFLNSQGKMWPLSDSYKSLNSREMTDITNSLTGAYIYNANQSIADFTREKINEKISNLSTEIADKKSLISDDLPLKEKVGLNLQLSSISLQEQRLKDIVKDNTLINTISNRITNKLEKYTFKYDETVDDKEDYDTHEDIANFIKESDETSNRAVNDYEILRFLSSIPRFENFNEDPSLQTTKISPLLLTPSYMEQNQVWNLLENIFANVIPNNITSGILSKDLFDGYIAVLEHVVKTTRHPELNYILNKLDTFDENQKTKLVSAFFKGRKNYLITKIDNSGQSLLFEIIDPATKDSKTGKIANDYVETVMVSDIDLEDYAKTTREKFNKIKKSSNVLDYKNFIQEEIIDRFNLQINPRTLDYYIALRSERGIEGLLKQVNKFINTKVSSKLVSDVLAGRITGEIEVLENLREIKNPDASDNLKKYLLSKDTFLKSLAEADTVFRDEVSESTVIVAGKQRWQLSYMSGLNLEILKWQAGDISSLEKLRERGLGIVDYLLEDTNRIQNLKLYTNSEIKKENDSSPVIHKKITELDLHMDIFAKIFNSKDTFYEDTVQKKQSFDSKQEREAAQLKNYTVYNFGADKNSLYSVYGLPRASSGKSNMYNIESKTLGSDMKAILTRYIRGEFERIKEATDVVDGYFNAENPQQYLMDNLIPGYHYNTSKDIETTPLNIDDFKEGNYYKLGIFTSSFTKFLDSNYDLVFEDINGPQLREEFLKSTSKEFPKLMDLIYSDFNNQVQKDFEYLNKIKLRDKSVEVGEETIIVGENIFDVNTNIAFDSKDQKIYSYILASFIANYELSNIFNGHISYYKQDNNQDQTLTDFQKRATAIVTDGLYPRHRNTAEPKTYTDYSGTVHTIKDKDDSIVVAITNIIEPKKSKYIDLINLGRGGKKLAYKHEVADAQGYITDTHFRDLIERIYGWNEYDTKMFDQLLDRKHSVTDENIKWIKRFSKAYSPLKMVYFGKNDTGVPVYLKYSLAPLFPAITAGNDMQKVYDQMKKQGVEQMVFQSGSKASNNAPTTIHEMDGDNFTGFKSDFKFNPFLIDSTEIKMQVQMPTKTEGSIKTSDQAWKNIMANLNLTNEDLNYTYKGKPYSAEDIYDLINATGVSILQHQLGETLDELKYDPNTDTFDKRAIKRLLINQMDIETEADLIYFLESNAELETIPNFAQRAFPVLAAYIQKNAGNIYTNGSSLAQVANIGYDRLSTVQAKGVFFFDKQNAELTPPIPKLDKDGNITGIKKGKVLVPFSSIFKDAGISYDEFIKRYKAGKIDKRIFTNMIGYRTPNQAMSNNDSLEVVGILPPIAGDQAILYHEITAKTGSDFDIDKLYTMMPNYEVKPNGDIDYITGNSKKAKQNDFIELLGSIMEAPISYDDLMSPLDNKELIKGSIDTVKYKKAVANLDYIVDKKLTEEENQDKYLDSIKQTGLEQMFPVALVKSRTDVLEAKQLISIMANNMTDISESQKVFFGLSYPIGFKDTSLARIFPNGKEGNNEEKITKIVSYLMNAAVDAAKDNYIIEGNFNTYTANAAVMLTRMGVSLDDMFTILMSPSIMNLSRDKKFSGAKISDYIFKESEEVLNGYSKTFLTKLNEAGGNIFDVITREEFLSPPLSNEAEQNILGFWNMLQVVGKEFNDSVVAAKAGPKGAGANIPEFLAIKNKIEKVKRGEMINPFKKWHYIDKDNNFEFNSVLDNNTKILGAQINNTFYLMEKLSKELFLETSPAAIKIVNDILSSLGSPLETNVQSIKLIYNYVYPYLLYSTGHKIYDIDINQEEYLLKDFPTELQKVKVDKDNLFLNELTLDTRLNKNLIRFPNFKNFDSIDKLKYKESILNLMKTNPVLVDNLIQYAFLTTGFKSTYYSFNDMIPANYFINNFHGQAVSALKDVLSNPQGMGILDFPDAITFMAKTNSNNFKIVRPIGKASGILSGRPLDTSRTKGQNTLEKLTLEPGRFYPFIKRQSDIMMLVNVTEGKPVYETIKEIDQKKFRTYSFNTIEQELFLQNTAYTSDVAKLFEGLEVIDGEILGCKL